MELRRTDHRFYMEFVAGIIKAATKTRKHVIGQINLICRPFHIHGLSQESSGMSVSQMTTDMEHIRGHL
jgi:hypothetical protein